MNSTGGTAAEAMDVGESTGIQCPPELVLREERSGELLLLIRWRLQIRTMEGGL